MDVFKSQMRRFGKPRKPFYIILSKDDKALGFSSFVAGGRDRLGAYQNVNELAALGAVVIDLTDLKAIDSSDHSKFAQIASIAPQLRTVLEKGIDANSKTLSQNAPSVGTTLGDVISMPIRIVGEPITIITGR